MSFAEQLFLATGFALGLAAIIVGVETLRSIDRPCRDLPGDMLDMDEIQRQVRLGQQLLEQERGRKP